MPAVRAVLCRDFCVRFAPMFRMARALLLKPTFALYGASFLYSAYLLVFCPYFLLSLSTVSLISFIFPHLHDLPSSPTLW